MLIGSITQNAVALFLFEIPAVENVGINITHKVSGWLNMADIRD